MHTLTKTDIKSVHIMLKDRKINPSGTFDGGGRFYAANDDLISVRAPSRAYPYPQMTACRTLKYVRAVAEKYNCTSVSELVNYV